MQNIWVNKKRGITTDEIRTVAKENNILPETALILLKRFERDEIPSVLSDTDMVIYDAHMLKDAEEGAKLIAAAIKKGSKICVVNDYDVDGVTSGYIISDIYIDIIYSVKYSEWNGNPSISYIIKGYK